MSGRVILMASCLLGLACASASAPAGSREPSANTGAGADRVDSFGHVMILGLDPRDEVRVAFERSIAGAFDEAGVAAVASHDLLSAGPHQATTIKTAAQHASTDALLVTRIVGAEEVASGDSPDAEAAMFDAYYVGALEDVGLASAATVQVETHLFDIESSDPVWSTRSDSFASTELDEMLASYSRRVIDALTREGLVHSTR